MRRDSCCFDLSIKSIVLLVNARRVLPVRSACVWNEYCVCWLRVDVGVAENVSLAREYEYSMLYVVQILVSVLRDGRCGKSGCGYLEAQRLEVVLHNLCRDNVV